MIIFLINIQKKKKIFYIYENYSWQKIIERIAKLKKHRECYAFQHSSIRFWDTRYFFDNIEFYPNNFLISNIEYFNYLKKFNIENINQVENLRLKILDKLQLKKKNNKCLIFLIIIKAITLI